jgi:predicted transcriptional regulator
MTFVERPLERVTVDDVMHTGILMTDPETPLKTVARLMADRQVHAVAVADAGSALGPFGIISTLDIAAVVASGEGLTAADASRGDVTTVRADEQLETAASLMVEKQTEHLLVINPATGHAEGVLSALDVAGAYGACP